MRPIEKDKKTSKPQAAALKTGMGYKLHIFDKKISKTYVSSNPSIDTPLMKSTESTCSGFEYQHRLCFVAFVTKKLYRHTFVFETSKSTSSDEYVPSCGGAHTLTMLDLLLCTF